jgi:hypothetical protein
MDKNSILKEIRRTAQENAGKPLGRLTFERRTGIRESDWAGRYWARWGDAVKEAGFQPNVPYQAYSVEKLALDYISLARELGHLPTNRDLRLKARSHGTFPSHNIFVKRLGRTKSELIKTLRSFCSTRSGFDDILMMLKTGEGATGESEKIQPTRGSVYLLKSGKFYKIGRSNSVGRREYELRIQLPETARVIHEIVTDDPAGIEDYWHQRFAGKRKNGEWFALEPDDVRQFKSRKTM